MKSILFFAGIFLPVMLYANTIFLNGKIYTVNKQQPWAQALVVNKNKIVFVGSTLDALAYQNNKSKIIDLKHQFMMPGIIDAHTHIAIASLLLNGGVNLLEAKGKEAIFNAIKTYSDHSAEELITGFGFYPFVLGQKGPTAKQLDALVANKKAFIISNNGHAAWANTKALKILNINANTKDPLPGMHYYMRDAEGNPTGFLVEGEAFWPHLKRMGIGSKEKFYKSLKMFLPRLSKLGITSIFDAGIPAVESNAYEALALLEKEKQLPLRYFGSHYIISKEDAKNALITFSQLQKRFKSSLIGISTVKFSNDNSDDDHFAMQFRHDQLEQYFAPLAAHDIDIMVHASHDLTVNQTLNAIENIKKDHPMSQTRFALAHVNMVRESDFQRFKNLNVIANIQPFNAQGGAYYDYRYMLYEDWENKLVRFKTFFDKGITVSASSDFPACNASLSKCTPFDSMQIGITRQAPNLDPNTPILPSSNERLSIEQMIEAYTINAAYQLHQEDILGSLEIGKKADLIVLNQNLLKIDHKKIFQTKVIMTMVNGEIVYEKER